MSALVRTAFDAVLPGIPAALEITARPILRPTFDNAALAQADNFDPWFATNAPALKSYWAALGGGTAAEFEQFVAIQFDRECLATPLNEDEHSMLSAEGPR